MALLGFLGSPLRTIFALCVCCCAGAAHGAFLSDRELFDQTCTSNTRMIVSRVTVNGPPPRPIDVVQFPTDVSLLRLECLEVHESLTNDVADAALLRSCTASGATFSLCQALADDAVPDSEADYTCTSITDYLRTPRQTKEFGEVDGPKLRFKLQWFSELSTAACYPKDLTVQLVALEPRSHEESLPASIAFVFIVGAVGIGITLFVVYQVRRAVSTQFKRAEQGEELPPLDDEEDDLEHRVHRALGYRVDGSAGKHAASNEASPYDDDADGGEGVDDDVADAPVRLDDIYGDPRRGTTPAGRALSARNVNEQQQQVYTDHGRTLQSRPMPKPWFVRNSYRAGPEPAPAVAPPQQAFSPPSGTAGYNTRAGRDPAEEFDDERSPHRTAGGGHPPPPGRGSRPAAMRGVPPAGPLYNPARGVPDPRDAEEMGQYDREPIEEETEEPDDHVLACGDCGLPIHDQSTPPLCRITGKRHY